MTSLCWMLQLKFISSVQASDMPATEGAQSLVRAHGTTASLQGAGRGAPSPGCA